MNKKTLWIWIFSLLTLVGCGLSVFLTKHYYEIHNGSASLKSFCNFGDSFNCDTVTASEYSEIGFGLPVSGLAAGYFLSLFILSLLSHRLSFRREIRRFLVILTAWGLIFSLSLLAIMVFKVKSYCVFCLGLDLVGFLSFGAALLANSSSKEPRKTNFQQIFIMLGICAGSIAIAFYVLSFLDAKGVSEEEALSMTTNILNAPVTEIPTQGLSEFMGPANAPITIVEFSDFQCPFCRFGAQILHGVQSQYKDKIRIIFRNFPLDRSCAYWMGEHQMHPHACEAARAAFCASKGGHFKETYEGLFDDQKSFADEGGPKIKEIVQKSGVDLDSLQNCLTSIEPSEYISKDIEEGRRLELNSTPTFYINGHQVRGIVPVTVWKKVIDTLLAQSAVK